MCCFSPRLLVLLLWISATAGSDYLGEKPPHEVPVLFAPQVVSTGLHDRGISFAPDGNSCYWFVITGAYTVIMESRRTAAGWSAPRVAPFSGSHADFEPTFSSDGQKLVFASDRPGATASSHNSNFWVVEQTPQGWSKPRPLGRGVNSDEVEYCPSLTRDGTLYFGRINLQDGSTGLYRARLEGDQYASAEALPQLFSEAGLSINATIAPDESFLLFPDKRPTAQGDADFFIAYRNERDQWSPPQPLNLAFRSWHFAESAQLSPDGRYVFFSYVSQEVEPGSIWARPKGLARPATRADLLKFHESPGNGQLDVFWVSASILPKPNAAVVAK